MKKRIICILLSVLMILSLTACGEDLNFIITDIPFAEGNFNVIENGFAVFEDDDGTEIFKINRRNGNLDEYYALEKSTLIDSKRDKILFKGSDGYFVFDITGKKRKDLRAADFPVLDQYVEIGCKFSENADSIIVTKVVRNPEESLKAGNTVIGYNLESETGIYLYDVSGKLKSQVQLSDFGIKNSVKLEIIAVGSDSKNIGVVLKYSALGTSFSDEAYYSVDISAGKYEKIGEYKSLESMDIASETLIFSNYYVNINSLAANAVDFVNRKIIKVALPDAVEFRNRMLYISENEEDFVINQANSGYFRCKISKDSMEFETIDSEIFSADNYFVSDIAPWSRVQPSSDFYQNFSEKEFGKIYKTVNDNCYITEADENFCIIYK